MEAATLAPPPPVTREELLALLREANALQRRCSCCHWKHPDHGSQCRLALALGLPRKAPAP